METRLPEDLKISTNMREAGKPNVVLLPSRERPVVKDDWDRFWVGVLTGAAGLSSVMVTLAAGWWSISGVVSWLIG